MFMWVSYISKQIDEISALLASWISYSAKDLEDNNTKAEDVGFNREDTLWSILRGHVATKMVYDTCQNYFIWSNCNINTHALKFMKLTMYQPLFL
jgi:hypothetical protein